MVQETKLIHSELKTDYLVWFIFAILISLLLQNRDMLCSVRIFSPVMLNFMWLKN